MLLLSQRPLKQTEESVMHVQVFSQAEECCNSDLIRLLASLTLFYRSVHLFLLFISLLLSFFHTYSSSSSKHNSTLSSLPLSFSCFLVFNFHPVVVTAGGLSEEFIFIEYFIQHFIYFIYLSLPSGCSYLSISLQ